MKEVSNVSSDFKPEEEECRECGNKLLDLEEAVKTLSNVTVGAVNCVCKLVGSLPANKEQGAKQGAPELKPESLTGRVQICTNNIRSLAEVIRASLDRL